VTWLDDTQVVFVGDTPPNEPEDDVLFVDTGAGAGFLLPNGTRDPGGS
jgi:hypothetical protein